MLKELLAKVVDAVAGAEKPERREIYVHFSGRAERDIADYKWRPGVQAVSPTAWRVICQHMGLPDARLTVVSEATARADAGYQAYQAARRAFEEQVAAETRAARLHAALPHRARPLTEAEAAEDARIRQQFASGAQVVHADA